MEARQPILPESPRALRRLMDQELDTLDDSDRDKLARAGMVPDSFMLDQKLKAKLSELGRPMTDYAKLVEEVHRGLVTL